MKCMCEVEKELKSNAIKQRVPLLHNSEMCLTVILNIGVLAYITQQAYYT